VIAPAWGLDTNAVLNGWFEAQARLQTWSAEFTEIRTFKALAQPLQTTGQVWVVMPDRFRWELGRPPQTIAVRQADELAIVYPRLKRAERYRLDETQPAPWKDALALLEAGLPRSREELESRFRITGLQQTNAAWRVSLQPRSTFARQLMPELQVELSTNTFILEANQVTFSDGSTLRDEFRHAQVNAPLSPALFMPPIEPDFKATTVTAP
jgi:outer membrane lipoprotein-sorting protein